MQVAEIELYKVLKTKFSESEAKTILANLNIKVQNKFQDRKSEFATKDDLSNVRVEMSNLSVGMSDTKTDISHLKV